jgi:hypothetical protein
LQGESGVTRHYEGGKLIQSVVKRIRNRPECHACHGKDREFIGTLHMDMSFGQTQNDLVEMEQSALWTVILTGAVMAAGGGILMTRLVDRRVSHLVRAMARVEAGDLNVRADPGGRDEIGRLGESFNTMVERLRIAREEIEAYHRHRLERAERLATMGEVAASLAHEIKNPLAGIAGAVGVMAEELAETDPRKEIMGEILAQIRRLTKTVQDLLTFARPSAPSLEMCDLPQVIDRVLLLLAEDPTVKQVRVIRRYQPGLPRLEADGKQLGQVFLNLLLNAAQAMNGRGEVTIVTRLAGHDADRSERSGRQTVEVCVTDTGPGIPAAVVPELFTPFFSTKPRGTGLGLAISRRILEDHGGWIRVESPPGQGATFRVVLPVGPAVSREGGAA